MLYDSLFLSFMGAKLSKYSNICKRGEVRVIRVMVCRVMGLKFCQPYHALEFLFASYA